MPATGIPGSSRTIAAQTRYSVLINQVLNNPVTLSGTIVLSDLSVGPANSLNLGSSAQLRLTNSLGTSGRIDVGNGAFLFLSGGGAYTNDGTLALNAISDSRLVLDGTTGNTVRLNGSGTLHLGYSGGGGMLNLVDAYGGAMTLENGPNHTIMGSGTFTNFALRNEGTITASQASGINMVNPSGIANTSTGMLEATNGSTLRMFGPITNDGTIRAHGGTVMVDNSSVTGGSIVVSNNGTLELLAGTTVMGANANIASGQATLTQTTVSGGSFTVGGGLTMRTSTINSSLTNDGSILVTGGLSRMGGTVVNNAGRFIDVADGAYLVLSGGGSYTNHGTLALNAVSDSRLVLDGTTGNTVRLNGSGTLRLGYSGGGGLLNLIDAYGGPMTLENGPNHKIVGSGTSPTSRCGTKGQSRPTRGLASTWSIPAASPTPPRACWRPSTAARSGWSVRSPTVAPSELTAAR